MSAKRATSVASVEGVTSLGSLRPIGPLRRYSASRSRDQRCSDTVAASPSLSASSSPRCRQGSTTTRPSLMSGIKRLLEGREADAAIGIGKALAIAAQAQIDADEIVDRVRHLLARDGRADNGAERRVLVGAAADGDLVELFAVLVDAEDADMADVMMAAGIDAARNLDVEIADLAVARGEMRAEALGNRDRARIGKAAKIEPGACDDVAGKPDIGGAEPGRVEALPHFRESRPPDMGQHQILLVAHADLAAAVGVGEIGDELHLLGAGIAGRAARRLQGDCRDRMTRRLMRRDVALEPACEGRVRPRGPAQAFLIVIARRRVE